MSSLTFAAPESTVAELTERARVMGVEVDELLRRLTDEFLARSRAVDAASRYVLDKNAELYRRLAK